MRVHGNTKKGISFSFLILSTVYTLHFSTPGCSASPNYDPVILGIIHTQMHGPTSIDESYRSNLLV